MCAMERRLKEKLLFKGDPKWRRKLAWKCVFGVLCFRLTVDNSVQEMWVTGFVRCLSFCFQLYLHCFAFNQVMISWVQCKHHLLFSSKLFSKRGPRICSFCGARKRKKREPKSTKDYLSVFVSFFFFFRCGYGGGQSAPWCMKRPHFCCCLHKRECCFYM